MRRVLVLLGFFAVCAVVLPSLGALAGTKLYLEQEGVEPNKDEKGNYRLYNIVPTKPGDYQVPLGSKLQSSNKTALKIQKGIPDTWRVLDQHTINNRMKDTRKALANAAKIKATLPKPEPWPSAAKKDSGTSINLGPVKDKGDAKRNERIVEKDMKKKKKEMDKAQKKKAKQDEKDKAAADKKKAEDEKKKKVEASGGEEEEKNNVLKRKKKSDDTQGKRLFNIP